MADPAYVELQVTTNYSFLRGASHVEELFAASVALGLPAVAVTDHNTLAGIARAHARAEEVGVRLIVGCRLDLQGSLPVLVYPTSRAAYAGALPVAGRLAKVEMIKIGEATGTAGAAASLVGRTWSAMATA